MPKRNIILDVLRCFAITLVMFRHSNAHPILVKIGWIGVDLFFVLSGFLVSGLVFNEVKQTGKFNGRLFLIRRGFKIYPPFLFSLVLFLVYFTYKHIHFGWDQIFTELFFLQNFRIGIMGITWTIAIEEHFYFFLVILSVLAVRKKFLTKKVIILLVAGICILSLFLRLFIAFNYTYSSWTHLFPTYLRWDALFFGVLISWFYHEQKQDFCNFIKEKNAFLWLLALPGLIMPFLFFVDQLPMYTIGFTALYVSFGIILSILIAGSQKHYHYLVPLAYIGRYSYFIYLIHMLIGPAIANFTLKKLHLRDSILLYNSLYIFYNIFFGILISLFVERYFLRLRDKYFPRPFRRQLI